MSSGRRTWLVVGVIVAILFAGWIGWAVADRGGGGVSGQETKFGRMVESGQMQAMLDQHRHMMEQMRVDASPPMVAKMNADPMWQLMRNDEFTKMMEDQQRQIDRMLGRGAP